MHYFFSDAHLGIGTADSNRQTEMAVVRFLEMVVREKAESLWIVGDLFDYWFDYRTVIPRPFVRVLAAIARVRESGIPVEYVIGNHDFGHYTYFEKDLGVTIHAKDVVRDIAGRKCLISHGDSNVSNDIGYRILKTVLRSRIAQGLFRVLHPDIGIGAAMFSSRNSRKYTEAKQYGEGDSLSAYAKRAIEDHGYNLVVMGHNHRAVVTAFGESIYVNLGTWMGNRRTYLALDESRCELRVFEGSPSIA